MDGNQLCFPDRDDNSDYFLQWAIQKAEWQMSSSECTRCYSKDKETKGKETRESIGWHCSIYMACMWTSTSKKMHHIINEMECWWETSTRYLSRFFTSALSSHSCSSSTCYLVLLTTPFKEGKVKFYVVLILAKNGVVLTGDFGPAARPMYVWAPNKVIYILKHTTLH